MHRTQTLLRDTAANAEQHSCHAAPRPSDMPSINIYSPLRDKLLCYVALTPSSRSPHLHPQGAPPALQNLPPLPFLQPSPSLPVQTTVTPICGEAPRFVLSRKEFHAPAVGVAAREWARRSARASTASSRCQPSAALGGRSCAGHPVRAVSPPASPAPPAPLWQPARCNGGRQAHLLGTVTTPDAPQQNRRPAGTLTGQAASQPHVQSSSLEQLTMRL